MVSMLHRARLKLKQIRNLFCVYSTAGLQRVRLGAFERYGEVLSGAFIALVGLAFWIWPVL